MESRDIHIEDPVEALAVERALAMVRELKKTCRTAPYGMVLELAETQAVMKGRDFMTDMLEAVMNAAAQEVEKKGRPLGPAIAEGGERTRGDASEPS
jgi:hypothetical protein